jgi:alanine adding enzyme
MKFGKLDEKEFRKFALAHDQSSYAQSPEFARLRESLGGEVEFLGVRSGKNIIAASVVAWHMNDRTKFGDAYCGWLADYDNPRIVKFLTDELKKYAAAKKAVYFSMNPTAVRATYSQSGEEEKRDDAAVKNLEKNGWIRGGETTPHFVFIKDLAGFENAAGLRKSFKQRARTGVSNAEKNCLTARSIDESDIPTLHKIMVSTAERQHRGERSLDYYEKLFAAFKSSRNYKIDYRVADINLKKLRKAYDEKIRLLTAAAKITKTDGQRHQIETQITATNRRLKILDELNESRDVVPISAGVYIESKRETVYIFGGTDAAYMSFNAVYEMVWEKMLAAFERKVPRFNFYGVSGRFDGSDGVLKFKQGFNGYVEEYLGQWILPVDEKKYRALERIRKVKHFLKH